MVWTGLGIQTASRMRWEFGHGGFSDAIGAERSPSRSITELIRSGPYRFVRHPIYTAWLGMFAGTAIVSGQMHALLGFAMAAFAYWRKIRLEEANLRNAFGPEYDAYRRETWALVPWLL